MTYMNRQGEDLVQIEEGDMVGEVEVILNTKRKYFAATKTDVVLFLSKANYFLELLKKYPLVRK